MNARADRQLWATARLVENLAELMPDVRTHVRTEHDRIDSHNDHTPGASDPTGTPRTLPSGPCAQNVPSRDDDRLMIDCGRRRPCGIHDSPVALTSVERAVEQRLRLTDALDDIEAQVKLIAVAAADALRNARRLIGTRTEEKITECRDGQHGKDGAIEWGDPTCTKPAVKSGMCTTHYTAWYRWRKRVGVDTAKMFEPGQPAA